MKRIVLVTISCCLLACSQTTTTQGSGDVFELANNQDINEVPVTIGGAGATGVPNVDADRTSETWIPETDDFVLVDEQTGSTWNLRGEAIGGPLLGAQLTPRAGFNAFWFAWSTFYHDSEVWSREVNETAPIEATGSCAVPCDEIRQGCGGGRDCIPALDYDGENGRPVAGMVNADRSGASYLRDFDQVLGVVIDGKARAYPHNVLWWHEVHNDKIGEREFTVTFCPLTGSGIVFDGSRDGQPVDFEVSGNLYNSNLVMVDRQTDSFWSQMMLQGISGESAFETLTVLPVVETTWARWRQMHPDTLVASDAQGYPRDYTSYLRKL